VKVRTKLLLVMAILVLFMASVFYTISHGYMRNLFQQYAQAAEQQEVGQWARLLAYYYESNGNSWLNANVYVEAILNTNRGGGPTNHHIQSIVVVDNLNKTVVSVEQGGKGPVASYQHATPAEQALDHPAITYPIVANGAEIGTIAVSDTGLQSLYAVEYRVLHSITLSIFWGVLPASVLALLIGAWLSRTVTGPLGRLLTAIEFVEKGDQTARVEYKSNDEFGRVGQAFNQMTEKLFQTEQARQHLVADIAHELRTPLTIMQGQLELIQQGVIEGNQQTILSILDEVMRLSGLVEDLRQLALAEVGALPMEMASIDLVNLMRRILDIFQFEADENAIDLHFTSDNEEVIAVIDKRRITQVFVNLLGNSLRHTPHGGKVSVRLQTEIQGLTITVEDSGSGIAPEHIPYVFNRFYRVNEDRSRETGGMGIGLAIAKEFVEAHGGRIEIQSTVGTGTTFCVKIPF